MARAAEIFEKNGISLDKISSEMAAPPQKFIPPFGSGPPFVKNLASPPFGQFSKNGQPPLKPGGGKLCGWGSKSKI